MEGRHSSCCPWSWLFKATCLLCWLGLNQINRADHRLNSTVNKYILLVAWDRRSFPAFAMAPRWDNWNVLDCENAGSPSRRTNMPPKLELDSQEKSHPTSQMFFMHQHQTWRLARETAELLLSTCEDLHRDKVSRYITFRETCATRDARNSERHLWRQQPSRPQTLPCTTITNRLEP